MRWRARVSGILIVWCALSWGVWAQPAPRLEWTWVQGTGPAATHFEVVIDGGAPVSVGLPTPSGTTYTIPLPTMSLGAHTLVVQACNGTVCAAAPPIVVVRL